MFKDGKDWDVRLFSTDERRVEPEDIEEEKYVESFGYDIVVFHWNDDGTEEVERLKIGEVLAYRFNGDGAFVEGNGLANALIECADMLNQDVYEISEAFYGHPEGPFEGQGVCASFDLLYLSRIFIEPEWRGLGLGFQVSEAVIRAHGQTANLALRPMPTDRGLDEKTMKQGQRKLTSHWKKLGLVPYHGNKELLWHCADNVRKTALRRVS